MLSGIDWRASVAYRHAKTIPAAGFAWEYLIPARIGPDSRGGFP
ncbi:transcriptional regulator domain-containing protein [Amaricoccus sp.]